MRHVASCVLCAAVLSGCGATHRAPYVAVPQLQFRSDGPLTLPLSTSERDALLVFFSHGGNRFGADIVPDADSAARRQALDSLTVAANLIVRTTTTRAFCDIAAELCQHAALFRKQPVVRQVVDARDTRPPAIDPVAVSDGRYWWIFRRSAGRFTDLLVVRSMERTIMR